MVVEWLTFAVDPAEQEQWIEIDAATWTVFLRGQRGFVRKEVWLDRAHPELIHVAVWWPDEECWNAVTQEAVDAVDASMGWWYRSGAITTFDVVREG